MLGGSVVDLFAFSARANEAEWVYVCEQVILRKRVGNAVMRMV